MSRLLIFLGTSKISLTDSQNSSTSSLHKSDILNEINSKQKEENLSTITSPYIMLSDSFRMDYTENQNYLDYAQELDLKKGIFTIFTNFFF